MTFIPFPQGTMESIFNFTWNGIPGQWTNGWLYNEAEPATPSQGEQIGFAAIGWWSTYKHMFLPSFVFESIVVNDLTSESGWQVVTPVGSPGTSSGTAPTNQAAMTVTLLTNLRGRSYRGRNYVAGLPQSDLASPTAWTDAAASAVTTAWLDWIGMVVASSIEPVVLSRYLDKAPRSVGHTQQIVNVRGNVPVHTQRRRLT